METAVKNKVKEIAWPGKTFITIRGTLPFDKLTTFFSKNYGAIYGAINKIGLQANEPPCAIYYSVDEAKKVTDLAAAVPVSAVVPEIQGFTKVGIPAAKALTITHYGSYDSMASSYALLEKYMAEHGLKRKWMIEEYLSDPVAEKDPSTFKTNIYFLLE